MDYVSRRLFELLEPICLVTFFADEPTEELMALGCRNYWDGYFAGRAAPLGQVPAEVVHALFYNFADGEVARHIPKVWGFTTPEAALAARTRGSAAAVRRILGDLADSPGVGRAADLLAKAAGSAPTEGRPMYAALRTVDLPDEPVARLWHTANMLREHRGDGHVAALLSEGIGGLEAHAMLALYDGMPAEKFGRIHHLPKSTLQAIADGMRARGLIDDEGWLTDEGRAAKERVEALTDRLAMPPYDALSASELDELIRTLEPISARLSEAGSR